MKDEWQDCIGQAKWLVRDDKYSQARAPAERAVELAERAFGPETEEMLESLTYLAVVWAGVGDHSKAEETWDRAIKLWERHAGAPHTRERT